MFSICRTTLWTSYWRPHAMRHVKEPGTAQPDHSLPTVLLTDTNPGHCVLCAQSSCICFYIWFCSHSNVMHDYNQTDKLNIVNDMNGWSVNGLTVFYHVLGVWRSAVWGCGCVRSWDRQKLTIRSKMPLTSWVSRWRWSNLSCSVGITLNNWI